MGRAAPRQASGYVRRPEHVLERGLLDGQLSEHQPGALDGDGRSRDQLGTGPVEKQTLQLLHDRHRSRTAIRLTGERYDVPRYDGHLEEEILDHLDPETASITS